MDKFKKPYNSSRSRGPSSGRPSFGAPAARPKFGYSGGDFQNKPPMKKYDAVCSTCGKRCEVPFRPESGRPVYCAECFGAPHDVHAGNKGKFPPRDFSAKPSYAPPAGGKSIADLERQIGAMNTKIDTMLKILETMPQSHPAVVSAASASFSPASIENKSAFPVPANVTAPRKFAKKVSPAKKFVRKSRVTKRK